VSTIADILGSARHRIRAMRRRAIVDNPPLTREGRLDKGRLEVLTKELMHQKLLPPKDKLSSNMGIVVNEMIKLNLLHSCWKPLRGLDNDLI
jgi:hypothetical protein